MTFTYGVKIEKADSKGGVRYILNRPLAVSGDDPEAYARGLYGELHRADDAGAEWILVEALPPTPEWAGIADRLRRASSR